MQNQRQSLPCKSSIRLHCIGRGRRIVYLVYPLRQKSTITCLPYMNRQSFRLLASLPKLTTASPSSWYTHTQVPAELEHAIVSHRHFCIQGQLHPSLGCVSHQITPNTSSYFQLQLNAQKIEYWKWRRRNTLWRPLLDACIWANEHMDVRLYTLLQCSLATRCPAWQAVTKITTCAMTRQMFQRYFRRGVQADYPSWFVCVVHYTCTSNETLLSTECTTKTRILRNPLPSGFDAEMRLDIVAARHANLPLKGHAASKSNLKKTESCLAYFGGTKSMKMELFTGSSEKWNGLGLPKRKKGSK